MREKMVLLITRVLFPLAFIGVLSLVAFYSCNRPDGFEYFWFWVAVGFPFGLRRMSILIVPKGSNIATTLSIFAVQAILAGLIGGVFAIAAIIRSILTLIYIIIGRTEACA